MTISELKEAFAKSDLQKQEYINIAYNEFHKILFDYANNLGKTDIREISIDSAGVIFTVRSSGVKIRCQLGDHRSPPVETFNFADFEPKESRMMDKLFEGCKTFYDIGANIGWHSLNLAGKYRDSIFYCFEPIPTTYQHLQDNIRLNAFTNIFTHNIALSNKNSHQNFFFYEACSGNASAVNLTARDDVNTIECRQMQLDDFSKEEQLPQVDFIKCDVEGAELMVFQGALKTIKSDTPIILAEILRKWSKQYNYNPNEILQLFFDNKYRAFTTDGYSLIPIYEITEETIETNFFFLHEVAHQQKILRFEIKH
jgi:FkbM family methyltransferase